MSLQIPNHALLKKLDEGAMGEVWLGEHAIQKRRAAIKVLKPSAHAAQEFEQLFIRECQVLAAFDHPNIVRIYDSGKIEGRAYLVMEFLAGGTLLQRMKRGPVAIAEALTLIVQVAGGLGAAHKLKLIHRDLKPANIMLRDPQTPVLTDFGAARLLDRSTIYGKDGGIIGTPLYMSPEQITGKPLDGRSDLYALGVLFYELMTGNLPFQGGSFEEIGSQHLFAPLPRLPAALSALQPVLDRLLAKAADDRYPDAQAFIDALRQVFLDEESLRLQVGYAGTGMAWSSQLRALGFVLDTEQKEVVRVAQGLALAATGRQTAGESTTIGENERLAVPLTAGVPVSTRENANLSPTALAGAPGIRASRPRVATTGAVVVLLILVVVSFWVPGWKADPPAATVATPATLLPPPSSMPLSQLMAARDRHRSLHDGLTRLAASERLDLSAELRTSSELEQRAQQAMDAGKRTEAHDHYARASDLLYQTGVQLLDTLERGYRDAGERALKRGLLREAQLAVDGGRRVQSERDNWSMLKPGASTP